LSNIASVIKEEITRLARRELRGETAKLKKASAQYRSDIAALKRRVLELERQLSRIQKNAPKKSDVPVKPSAPGKVRFTAKGFRTLRQRLGLSANDMAKLIGVSAQSIYSWEREHTRPREQQVAAIAALRSLGKKEAEAHLRKAAK
jgi:DNA-binding XRE family transcriptional regulator